MSSHYLTKEGLENLKKELETLKKETMPQIIERISRAKELGDLSENAEYQDAKDEQAFIAGRIAEIDEMIHKAEIIKKSSDTETVSLGDTVKVVCDGSEHQYTIVGSNEANPTQGLISNESPLGQAFLGSKVGDKVKVAIPRGEMACEIIAIVS
ncbi:MAG: transcription elongation factor GreA [Candidatus Buchananbacteria bacterium RIFCSPLOWO2_01_FULL_46_12]|uniref:Transcription elongation factor GreA n=2 Tax=Candidatus Buchananiibacteriota TaxID=1817903 RepID=A0A1G1YPZ7_9BACT|nr:MAG: transcription elongation factor GreA [Candidatus Buchananbacteria bacterium RIFCSPHIGHO2_01_FULL_44_11]OGY53896.1 MAG: transcription elongation factor GreA [Candidatus Buchananbacteria bacterium RIFCSPLOWO2_01_FULL_46_12]